MPVFVHLTPERNLRAIQRRGRERDQASRAVQRGRALPTSAEGYEVFVPRAILPSEILRVKALPQVVGWCYFPGANGRPPCACICCERSGGPPRTRGS